MKQLLKKTTLFSLLASVIALGVAYSPLAVAGSSLMEKPVWKGCAKDLCYILEAEQAATSIFLGRIFVEKPVLKIVNRNKPQQILNTISTARGFLDESEGQWTLLKSASNKDYAFSITNVLVRQVQ